MLRTTLKRIGLYQAIMANGLYILLLCLIAAAVVALTIAKPIVFSKIIDEGILSEDWGVVQSHCIYFLIIALGLSLFGLGHALVASIIYNKISLIVKEVILDRIFLLDAEFFHTNKTGDVITKLDNDVSSIQMYIMSVLNTSMSNFLSFLGAMIYIGYVQWRMLVVGFLVTPFVGLAIYVFRNVLYSKDKKARELKSDVNDAIINSVDNQLYLRKVGLDLRALSKCKTALDQYRIASIFNDVWRGGSGSLNKLLLAVGYIVTIGYGSWLVFEGMLSVGNLFAFLTLRTMFLAPLSFFEEIYRGYFSTKSAFKRLDDFFCHRIEKGLDRTDNSKPESFETICLSNVSFSYPRQDHLLNRIDAQFGKGRNVLRGRNGVGKSSLIDLLMKISSPSEGRILVDGVDIAPINNRSWRSNISAMPQTTYLFKGSLRENIRLYDERITDDRIQFVLNNLGFDFDAEDLPAGLDTDIAEGGSNFSGGQRQKIAIARAVVKDTPIYIFDEPLSNLDVRSRGLALAYLKSALKGKIVLIVSHDDIGEYTDREYKMEDGTIAVTAVNGFERVAKDGSNALHLSV